MTPVLGRAPTNDMKGDCNVLAWRERLLKLLRSHVSVQCELCRLVKNGQEVLL